MRELEAVSRLFPASGAVGGVVSLLLGTDLVFVPRLTGVHQRHGRRFFERLLTERELLYVEAQAAGKRNHSFFQRLGARIALKEAVSKALGVGLCGLGWAEGVRWHEIELISHEKSPPALQLSGRALLFSDRLGVETWRVSLSHDGDYAMATVIGLSTG